MHLLHSHSNNKLSKKKIKFLLGTGNADSPKSDDYTYRISLNGHARKKKEKIAMYG